MISGRSPNEPDGLDPERRDDDLQADELQRDIGHGGEQAGHRDRQREPAVAEAAAHEIGRRDVAVLAAHRPQAREHHEGHRVDDGRVGHGEERDGAGPEGQRRHGDERVGGVDVAADQEPGDQRAEAAAGEAPFVQQVEIAAAPVGRQEAEERDDAEEGDENGERHPVDRHAIPVARWQRWPGRDEDDGGQDGADHDPDHLVGVEERKAEDASARRGCRTGTQSTADVGEQQKPVPVRPGARSRPRLGLRSMSLLPVLP